MRSFYYLIVTALLCLTMNAQAQNRTNSMEKGTPWAKVDSLVNIGKPESAKLIVADILKSATQKKQADEIIKAKAWLLALDLQQENAHAKAIQNLETEILTAKSPVERAIWQNMTAKAYLSYFQNNRYQIYQQTRVENNTSTDIATWDATKFHKKITELFLAAIAQRQELINVPTSKYKAIIDPGQNTASLRPSLYDLLVFDALDYFKSDERDVINPAYKFSIDEANYFGPATEFAKLDIRSKDSSSLQMQALKLYQEIISKNIHSDNIEGLIDADLSRLAFVYQYATLPNKEVIYRVALYALAKKYSKNPAAAQAYFLAAQTKLNTTGNNAGRHIETPVENKADLLALRTELQQIIRQYPQSEGAINAANLIGSLEYRSLKIELEEAYIPNENIKFLLSYKNIKELEISIYTTTLPQARNEAYQGKLIKTWKQGLINSEDLKEHSVELKADALPAGLYLVLIKDNKADLVVKKLLQVSNLSAVRLQGDKEENKLYVLDRKTGQYIADANLALINFQYQNKSGKYLGSIKKLLNGSKEGTIALPGDNIEYNTSFALVKGKDTFLVDQNESYSLRRTPYYQDENQASKTNFIFTDRSIYRPGQTIHFKGILLHTQNAKQHNVAANETVKVIFRDANYQPIKELSFTTNAYGSFSGSFEAPVTGLTGGMSISSEHGSVYFNVEEYKRPKFYVAFDTLKTNYKVEETIKVSGKALAYAGNNIDQATVKYRVVRNVRYPYPWLYRSYVPATPQMELINGSTTTDENGNFNFDFTAIPDKSIDASTLPVFTYTITVDITDINGETRSNTQDVAVGYRSLDIQLSAPSKALSANLNHISVLTSNLNGVFTPATVQVQISPLQSPDKFYRERLWALPTDFIYTESEFKQLFPADQYKEEWKPENRKKLAAVWNNTFTSTKAGKIELPENTWKQSGYYEIEVKAKDKEGKEVVQKQYIYVFVPDTKVQYDVPLFTASDKNSYQPGENIKLFVTPALAQANILQRNSWNKPLDWKKSPLNIPVTEADRGSQHASWLYVCNNRVYQATQSINIPWSNKDLSITWATHRDKLLPGAAEEWTMTIKGHQKEKVAAELVAGLYDASLEALKPHAWNWSKMFGNNARYIYWNNFGFKSTSQEAGQQDPGAGNIEKEYPSWTLPLDFGGYNRYYSGGRMYRSSAAKTERVMEEVANAAAPATAQRAVSDSVPGLAEDKARHMNLPDPQQNASGNNTPAIRTNLNETAFFIPQLQTDADGNIKIKFTIPEALTEWNFMAFAHTKDWQTGYLSGSVKTQKDLMVTPNLPRFFRQGDQITVVAKISNLSDKALNGKARIEIVDAQTLQTLNLPFGFKDNQQSFTVAAQQSSVVNFNINVPQARYEPVLVRVVAEAGDFSDGEEHLVPVVTNRMLVTETQPLPVRGNTTETFSLEKLLQSAGSNTLLHKGLTVEFTGNPAWYAVQALPYLMEFPYECAEQTFNRFYANALAGHIVAQSPKVAAIFDKWRTTDTAALLSNLQKNQELKTALLEETPWVLEAKSEAQQKQNIARLFETHQLSKGLNSAINKLSKMQNNDGSFGWFPGMGSNRYITQYILTGMAKLQSLNVKAAQDKDVQNILRKGLSFLDTEVLKDYRDIKKENLKQNNLSHSQIQYLYLRSFMSSAVQQDTKIAYDYYMGQEKQFWMEQNNYMQGMIALTQFRKADKPTANTIMESLSERAIRSKEMGMYWNTNRSYWWYDLPVEAHALLITAFEEIRKEEQTVDDLKVWLLKQKQTQNWQTTTATADAVYALLRSGTDWLQYEPEVVISLGNMTINSTQEKTEAGTGYFKKQIEGKDVKPEMGHIKVTVDNKTGKNTGTSWGSVYWQYFENMDKITSAAGASPLNITKQLYIETNTDRGPVLKEITANQPLKVGDKVKVRIVLKVDRDMEYVHMKDMRAAGFEPVNVLSGYKWNNGLGYYESTKDIATHFFFDRLPKGTFVFEYPLVVAQKGTFSNGITTAQCMYAPEFSSHTEGIRVEVK
ncbi:MAG: alpha-2-macroglobulin [Sphingobacteriales bacterium]|nr:MAG: alpha-2-macroglobulin [Sphingobacteriales bacterium]